MSDHKPAVLFVCVHNAGRSQMAAGYLTALAGDRIDALSAGSEPQDQLNPVAVQAMAEHGIDITGNTPTVLTVDAVARAETPHYATISKIAGTNCDGPYQLDPPPGRMRV